MSIPAFIQQFWNQVCYLSATYTTVTLVLSDVGNRRHRDRQRKSRASDDGLKLLCDRFFLVMTLTASLKFLTATLAGIHTIIQKTFSWRQIWHQRLLSQWNQFELGIHQVKQCDRRQVQEKGVLQYPKIIVDMQRLRQKLER